MINLPELRDYLESFQDPDGKIRSENSVKATAEFALVHRLCPRLAVGNLGAAKTYLRSQLSPFAEYQIKKGFSFMEKIWHITVGIPEDTLFLDSPVHELIQSSLSPSVKSALLLLLLMQKSQRNLSRYVQEIGSYQEELLETSSLDTVYETTHNLITFYFAQKYYSVSEIIRESCSWPARTVMSFRECIDVVAESAAVILLFGYRKDQEVGGMLDWVSKNQQADGGFPVYVGGKSEFHPSLVTAWACTARDTAPPHRFTST
ncbi:MAG: hypothetical protein HXS52_06080 [Theionarchaea archaeon]|nr:hypothetical protein [Theionarchaea archaeon]MBU7037479.1 hypothetical protein [Theionarchaea archaeon]